MLRLVQVFAGTMFILTTCALGLSGWWLFAPAAVITSSDFRLKVQTPVVAPGADLWYEVSVCKSGHQTAQVTRQLIDTVALIYPPQRSALPEGCGTYRMTTRIPRNASDGRYRLVITAEYRVNPLRDLSYRFESDEFEVRR